MPTNVRFQEQSGRRLDDAECPPMTQSEQVVHCSTLPQFYSALLLSG